MNFLGERGVQSLDGEFKRLADDLPIFYQLGERSLTPCPWIVLFIATFSEKRFTGSYRPSFSSSAGVY